mmetsp:Transcript_33883/g.78235  ORF Transcript_33883/g.78235 Transcript_33883/m.78235 type:complete len:98 (+) Transcript_33883:811-1104(+)
MNQRAAVSRAMKRRFAKRDALGRRRVAIMSPIAALMAPAAKRTAKLDCTFGARTAAAAAAAAAARPIVVGHARGGRVTRDLGDCRGGGGGRHGYFCN